MAFFLYANRDWSNMNKKKIYKLFLTLMVSLSLGSGPIAQNEILKLLEALTGTGDIKIVQELDEDESEKLKKFLNYDQEILRTNQAR